MVAKLVLCLVFARGDVDSSTRSSGPVVGLHERAGEILVIVVDPASEEDSVERA